MGGECNIRCGINSAFKTDSLDSRLRNVLDIKLFKGSNSAGGMKRKRERDNGLGIPGMDRQQMDGR